MTREELYNLVWEQPVVRASSLIGLSGPELRKLCADNNIPLPSAGYWSKRKYGKAGNPPPLPPLAATFRGRVNSALSRLGKVPLQISDDLKFPSPIGRASTLPKIPDPIVALFRSALQRIRVDKNGRTKRGGNELREERLESQVASPSLTPPPTVPSGRLRMEIFDPRPLRWSDSNRVGIWYDHHRRPLERCIRLAVKAIAGSAILIKNYRETIIDQARIQEAKQVEAALLELAQKEYQFLIEKAEAFDKLQKLSRFAEQFVPAATEVQSEPLNRMSRALGRLVDNMRMKLSSEAVNAEIVALGLFLEDPSN